MICFNFRYTGQYIGHKLMCCLSKRETDKEIKRVIDKETKRNIDKLTRRKRDMKTKG
jgi:hypothetical protein